MKQICHFERSVAMTANGSRLGEVGDLKSQSLKLLLMFKNSTNVK